MPDHHRDQRGEPAGVGGDEAEREPVKAIANDEQNRERQRQRLPHHAPERRRENIDEQIDRVLDHGRSSL